MRRLTFDVHAVGWQGPHQLAVKFVTSRSPVVDSLSYASMLPMLTTRDARNRRLALLQRLARVRSIAKCVRRRRSDARSYSRSSAGIRELVRAPFNSAALAFEPMLGSGWLAFSKTLAGKWFAKKSAAIATRQQTRARRLWISRSHRADDSVRSLLAQSRQSQRFPAHTVILLVSNYSTAIE